MAARERRDEGLRLGFTRVVEDTRLDVGCKVERRSWWA
jgi:hypothetical protein